MFSFFKKKAPPPAPANGCRHCPSVRSCQHAPCTRNTSGRTRGRSFGAGARGGCRLPRCSPPAIAVPVHPCLRRPRLVCNANEPPGDTNRLVRPPPQGLRKTGGSIAQVFTGTRIDDALYEELEAALLMADTGVKATEFLLQDLKRRVKDAKATDRRRP
jgi:fused signal recognition particle receptor